MGKKFRKFPHYADNDQNVVLLVVVHTITMLSSVTGTSRFILTSISSSTENPIGIYQCVTANDNDKDTNFRFIHFKAANPGDKMYQVLNYVSVLTTSF